MPSEGSLEWSTVDGVQLDESGGTASTIPLPTNLENARDEYEREVDEEAKRGPEEDGPYFEYEWFGVTRSYTKEGYWLRILIALFFLPILAGFFIIGEWGIGLLMILLYVGGISISILSLIRFHRDR